MSDATQPMELTEDVAAPNGLTQDEQEDIYNRAVCRARIRMSLYIHATVFVFVMLLLVVINLLTTPGILWVFWPFFGWGAALFLHWFLATKMVRLYQKVKSEEIARELED